MLKEYISILKERNSEKKASKSEKMKVFSGLLRLRLAMTIATLRPHLVTRSRDSGAAIQEKKHHCKGGCLKQSTFFDTATVSTSLERSDALT
jgi:hypothetical protein